MVPIVYIIIVFALPGFAIYRHGKVNTIKRPYMYSVGSFTACSAGIIQQLLTINRRLFSGDIAGIEDTIKGVIILCILMLLFTSVLNMLCLGLYYEKD